MAKTSNHAKQAWNARHYQQIKVSVDPKTAHAFKAACALSDVSMASVLSQYMAQYSQIVAEKKGYAPNLSTRRQRRAAVQNTIDQLERIRREEERYMDNIPTNLQLSERFELAEQCISLLEEAIELLRSAY